MSKNKGYLAAAATSALLAACAALPPDTPARIARPLDGYATARSFAAPAAPWPADRWWTRYGDPELTALVDEALAGSPTLAEARARLTKAQATRAIAAAALLPKIGAQASAQETKQSENDLIPPAFAPHGYQDYGQVGLDFSWELDFWGRNRQAVAAAASRARASEADLAEARLVLSTALASTYATLAQLAADRDVAETAVRVREQTAVLVAERVRNGLDTQAELKLAEAGAPASRAALGAIDEQIALTRNALAALAGEGPDRGLAIPLPAQPRRVDFALPADLRANLIGRRPDVVAARWRAEAAEHVVREAKAEFYPDINLAASIGQQALHLDRLFAAGSGIGTVGPALSLPIFQGGRLRANLRGARADRDEAVAAYDAAVAEALRQVADAAASERNLGDQLREARAALAGYEGAYRVAGLRYSGGLSTYQSVLLAEDAVLSERRVVADLESRAFALDVALVRALGGGFREA
ncbi:MAG: efflux transporter outer membrane subunit [Caulobacteraceae bacterium]|nr:efflux transporter outer membrane subunit [Caulobacteraceae bacterium]